MARRGWVELSLTYLRVACSKPEAGSYFLILPTAYINSDKTTLITIDVASGK